MEADESSLVNKLVAQVPVFFRRTIAPVNIIRRTNALHLLHELKKVTVPNIRIAVFHMSLIYNRPLFMLQRPANVCGGHIRAHDLCHDIRIL